MTNSIPFHCVPIYFDSALSNRCSHFEREQVLVKARMERIGLYMRCSHSPLRVAESTGGKSLSLIHAAYTRRPTSVSVVPVAAVVCVCVCVFHVVVVARDTFAVKLIFRRGVKIQKPP